MAQPTPTYAESMSSFSDLDSVLFSSQVTESEVPAFTTASERPEPFEDIQYPTYESVEEAPLMTGVPLPDAQAPTLVQHPMYYMQENMVVFQVDNTLYRVPAYAFVQQSQYFKSLLHKPGGSSSAATTHATESAQRIHLNDKDLTNVDFERLLSIMFPSDTGEYTATTLEEWTSILHLSVKWGFASIRAIAACEVFLLAPAVDRIVLGRKYGFDSWLLDALVEVCQRTDSLSLLEACRMSVEDYVRISQAREAVRLPGVQMDTAHIRAVVARIFGLRDGGIALEEASISTRTSPTVVDGSNQAQPFANGDKLIVGDELTLNVSIPISQIQVHTGWVVDGRPMRITYVPTFRGAQWVRRHRGSTTEGESATRPMNFRMPDRGVLACQRTVRAGVYSTLDVRPWTAPTPDTTKTIALGPSHVMFAPPKIAFGLSMLDVGGGGVRARAQIVQDTGTAHEAFTATISAWADTTLSSGAIDWLEVPTELGLQTGSATLYPPGGSPTLRDDAGKPVELAHVRFERPYKRPPTVVCWLTGLDMGKTRDFRVHTYADSVDGGGFTLCAVTWMDSLLYGTGATWIAIPQDAPGVFVGNYSANMGNRTGHVAFPRAFRRAPKVVIGINLLNFKQGRNLRVKAFARDVTTHGFVWEVQTWADSHMHQTDITVIAIEYSDLEGRAVV